MIGLTNGCFDLLHEGHLHLLREANRHCGSLIVAINSDASVTRLKGLGRPVETEAVRAVNVVATGLVDCVLCFDNEDMLRQAIRIFNVGILFKGAEYAGQEVTGSDLVPVHFIDMKPGFSTTAKIKGMMQ